MSNAIPHRIRRGATAARVALGALLAAGALACARPAAAAAHAVYMVTVPPGSQGEPDVAGLTAAIRSGQPEGVDRLVLLIHGFGTTPDLARSQYRDVAERLHAALGENDRTAVVGVCWASDPGSPPDWIGRSLERRVLSSFGVRNDLRDPYNTIAWRAQGVGRRGLRQILFGLEEAFPGVPVHLVSHSLGARVVMNALAPDLTRDRQDVAPAFEPERELQVDSVVLAGADLDANLFTDGRAAGPACAALARSRLWWFTAPRPGHQDRVLWLRGVHVGERAMGNIGPRFPAAVSRQLLDEGRLVIDLGHVPPDHWFVDYLCTARLVTVAAAMRYLDARAPISMVAGTAAMAPPEHHDDREESTNLPSILAELDQIRAAPATPAAMAPYLEDPSLTLQLYAAWRLGAMSGPGASGRRDFTLPRALKAVAAAREAVGR